jgi:hypothetical protein
MNEKPKRKYTRKPKEEKMNPDDLCKRAEPSPAIAKGDFRDIDLAILRVLEEIAVPKQTSIPDHRFGFMKALFPYFHSHIAEKTGNRGYTLAALQALDATTFIEAVLNGEIDRTNVDIIFPPQPAEARATAEFLRGNGAAVAQIPGFVPEAPMPDPFTQLNQSAQSAQVAQIIEQLRAAGVQLPTPTKPMPNAPMRDPRDPKAMANGQIVGGRWVPSV